jgi:hypothetical protein
MERIDGSREARGGEKRRKERMRKKFEKCPSFLFF